MAATSLCTISTPPAFSPLVLCDNLLSLAQEADHAGLRATATRLLNLATSVLDEPAALPTDTAPQAQDRLARH